MLIESFIEGSHVILEGIDKFSLEGNIFDRVEHLIFESEEVHLIDRSYSFDNLESIYYDDLKLNPPRPFSVSLEDFVNRGFKSLSNTVGSPKRIVYSSLNKYKEIELCIENKDKSIFAFRIEMPTHINDLCAKRIINYIENSF
jgi:hypothetical protein